MSRMKAEELALAREVARQKGADFAMVLTTGDEEAIHEARQKNDQNVNFHFNLPVKFKFDSDKREAPKK